jgi:superoxide dismutase, Cu-Zn family
MKKIAYVASLSLVLAGCGGSEDSKEERARDQEDKREVSVTVETAPSQKVHTEEIRYDQTARLKPDPAPIKKAFAIVQAKSGSEIVGAVNFTAVDGGVRVVADIGGLKPGKHGFHIHEHGDCSAHDGSSAGGHFNPHNKKHGGPAGVERHAGDLGNLEANQYGFAHYDKVIQGLELNGENAIIDKSIVVHEGEDDLVTDPSGNSGKRIGCGAIVAGES